MIEALILRDIPAEWIAGALAVQGFTRIWLGALVGAPAYLNGYAAVPLFNALLRQGMSVDSAMTFMLTVGVSRIPAAIAVWTVVN